MPENEALELNSIIFPQRSIAYFNVHTPPFCHTIAGGRCAVEPPAQRQSGRTPTLGRNTRACNAWTGSARGVVGMSLARQRGNVMNRLKFPVSPIDAVAKRPRGKLKI